MRFEGFEDFVGFVDEAEHVGRDKMTYPYGWRDAAFGGLQSLHYRDSLYSYNNRMQTTGIRGCHGLRKAARKRAPGDRSGPAETGPCRTAL